MPDLKKYQISFEDAKSAFYDEFAMQFFDEDHSVKTLESNCEHRRKNQAACLKIPPLASNIKVVATTVRSTPEGTESTQHSASELSKVTGELSESVSKFIL